MAKREQAAAVLGGRERFREALVDALRRGGSYRKACNIFNKRLPPGLRVSVPTFITWCLRERVALETRVVVSQ